MNCSSSSLQHTFRALLPHMTLVLFKSSYSTLELKDSSGNGTRASTCGSSSSCSSSEKKRSKNKPRAESENESKVQYENEPSMLFSLLVELYFLIRELLINTLIMDEVSELMLSDHDSIATGASTCSIILSIARGYQVFFLCVALSLSRVYLIPYIQKKS